MFLHRAMGRRVLTGWMVIFMLAPIFAQTPTEETTAEPVQVVEEKESWLLEMWRFEIISLEGKPLTVSKLVTGLFILIFSIQLARIFSRRMHDLFNRIGMNPSSAGAAKTLMFYALILIATMVTLEIIQVPLTVFTLLGGAVAIGVGFGSQNLLNNFISGLILLAERPIRVGDLIQIGDLHGTVATIGGRSTSVRTGQNVDIIIPNSSFLEQNVVNWTLGDDRVRTSVIVGLAYGSPVNRVEELLLLAANSDKKVLPEPKPLVLFSDFGDNALVFEVHFWIRMKSLMDQLQARSRLRFKIYNLFEAEGLVIAFPQRDIHLDADKPLEVRMVDSIPSPSNTPKPEED